MSIPMDQAPGASEYRAEIDRLRAELADLRCDDSCSQALTEMQTRAWEAEARLAAVIALCDATHGADARLYAAHVRAAATGDMK